jgi:hypothetical protein
MALFFCHNAIALQMISRYLAYASTNIGLVGRGCRSDGLNESNTTVLYDSRMIDSLFTEIDRIPGQATYVSFIERLKAVFHMYIERYCLNFVKFGNFRLQVL